MLEQKWNHNWWYWKNLDSFALPMGKPAHAKAITLPHDAMIYEKPYAESPNKGTTGYHDGGVYVYEKDFFVTKEEEGYDYYVKFDGIYQNAIVYINGRNILEWPYGYTTFYADITPFLIYGGENILKIEVRNKTMSTSRWYCGSGIYRDVYLLKGRGVYVVPDGVQIETLYANENYAGLEVRIRVKNSTRRVKTVLVRTQIYNENHELVQSMDNPLPLYAGETQLLRRKMIIEYPKCWSDEQPYLYTAEIEVIDHENSDFVFDQNHTVFGIRTLTLDAKQGLRVNGKEIKLRGACIHHDHGILGAACYEDAEFRRVRKLKEAGFNAIRMSHHPAAPALLRACDRLGMYVMDETFDMWRDLKSDADYGLFFNDWWEKDVEAMVLKDYNHPSVLLYSLGNEIPNLGREQGIHTLRAMDEKVKSIDNGRFTTIGINGVFSICDNLFAILNDVLKDIPENERIMDEGGNVNVFMTVMGRHMDRLLRHSSINEVIASCAAAVDVPGFNYMTSRYNYDHELDSNRVLVGSETYPPQICENWNIISQTSHVIGDFTWTGWDYIGEAGIGIPGYEPGEGGFNAVFPARLAYCGDIDITGFRRPMSYYREIVFGLRKEPYITVENPYRNRSALQITNWIMDDSQASWTYTDIGEKSVIVKVYSSAPEVELFLNGKSQGVKAAGPDNNCMAEYTVNYEKGELLARALYKNPNESYETSLITAGKAKLRVTKEKCDTAFEHLHFYEIEFVDENGIVDTSADREIRIEVKNGKLLGFGSGNPKTADMYPEPVTTTWNGRAQAIVQCENDPVIHIY